MVYQTVFDVTSIGYKSWPFPAFGLIFVVLGILLCLSKRIRPGWWRTHRRIRSALAYFYLGFATLWTLGAFTLTYIDYWHIIKAVHEGSATVVEGPVTNFKPMPATGHRMERFCVQQACFEYSDFVITAGFNNTSSHGGPIREGLPVRVTFVGKEIAKLEVAR